MMETYITVVVPVYNLEGYLRRVLDSIVAASRVLHSESVESAQLGVECICVDDGSTDESLNVLEGFSFSDVDISLRVLHQTNRGVSAARNCGMDEAKGKWVYFVDGDDAVADQVFLHVYKADLANKHLELFVMGTIVVNQDGSIREKKGSQLQPRIFETGKAFAESRSYSILQGRMHDKILLRETLKRNNIRFIEGLRNGEDTAFGLVYLSCCGRVFVDTQLLGYYYYLRPESATFAKLQHMPSDPFLLFRSLHSEWRKTRSSIIFKSLVSMVRGVLSLCLEDYYDESARKEAIDFLEKSKELRRSMLPFAFVHADWRTAIRLSLFCVLPHQMRIRFVHRICGGR